MSESEFFMTPPDLAKELRRVMGRLLLEDPQAYVNNATQLAEACAAEMGENEEGGWLDDPDHEVWTIAAEVCTVSDDPTDEDEDEEP